MTEIVKPIRVAVITSSRADFGIYLPLLRALQSNESFEMSIIAFGTHLSRFHGYTLHQIEAEGFEVTYKVESMLLTDTVGSTASSVALTQLKFAGFWEAHQLDFDLVFCLGDRFEMYSAVLAAVPFGIKFAHIHGGETTLGAIDNVYRHCISLASHWHFTSAEPFAARVAEIIGSSDNIYNVGSLSLENLLNMELLSISEFKEKFGIDLSLPSILITYHPETVGIERVREQTAEMIQAFLELARTFQLIITMPNTDTAGSYIREQYSKFLSGNERILIKENFGTLGFFSIMKHAKLILGNSSSGIIEAASFGKYVINVGRRQEGRLCSENVKHVSFSRTSILSTVKSTLSLGVYKGTNVYHKMHPSDQVIQVLSSLISR